MVEDMGFMNLGLLATSPKSIATYDFSTGSTPVGISCVRDSEATYYDVSGNLIISQPGNLRVEKNPQTGAVYALIEHSASNMCPDSTGFNSTAWPVNFAAITQSTVSAPYDTFKYLTELSQSGSHYVRGLSNIVSGSFYCFSVYAIPTSGMDIIQLTYSNATFTGGGTVNYNVSSRAVTLKGGPVSAGALIGFNGSTRVYMSELSLITTSGGAGVISLAANNPTAGRVPLYTGSANRMLIWGAQIETGTYPSSYIYTSAEATFGTRRADQMFANLAGVSGKATIRITSSPLGIEGFTTSIFTNQTVSGSFDITNLTGPAKIQRVEVLTSEKNIPWINDGNGNKIYDNNNNLIYSSN